MIREALATALLLLPAIASAAIGTGSIKGQVTDDATGQALPGVTVTVVGPALQGEETAFTDESGNYLITELPPGEYEVRFYFSDIHVERPNIFVAADKTLAVNLAFPASKAAGQVYRIIERAPNVDVANAQVQTSLDAELLRRIPFRGNTAEAAMSEAPGTVQDPVGVSFGGATGVENNFLLDGLNTTNPAFGFIGSPLRLEFVKELELITGGFNAEYGRSTGGVVNVVTKSGSNTFAGSVWFNDRPLQLDPQPIARLGEAVSSLRKDLAGGFDLGFELGGPIVKDRLWFYAGIAPTVARQTYDRIVRAHTMDGAATEVSRQTFRSEERVLDYIAKLDLRIDDDNRLSLEYLGRPSTFGGVFQNPDNPNPRARDASDIGFNGLQQRFPFDNDRQAHDLVGRVTSKLMQHKLQLDLIAGFHRESDEVRPRALDVGGVNDTRRRSILSFEPAPGCQLQNGFDPCPVSSYRDGGYGIFDSLVLERISASLAGTYFADWAGSHAIKLGGEAEQNTYRDHRQFTGGARGGQFDILPDGSVQRTQFATFDEGTMQATLQPGGFTAETRTLNEAFYLRDAYSPSFVPGLVASAGVRWELEQLLGADGKTQISIPDNLAPRLGLAYDFTRNGGSKLFASYARYYESIPMDVNDRQFSGEGLAVQNTTDCQLGPGGRIDVSTCRFPTPGRADTIGGTYGKVSPVLKGQYSDEVVLGVQYDVGLDLVLGVTGIHRDLGRIIEDISPDGGRNFIIANPGEPTDPSVVRDLERSAAQLEQQATAETDPTRKAALVQAQRDKAQQLALYKGVEAFPKPKREYNALVLTADKRLTQRLTVHASYTYSRTTGNYPGLYSPSNNQLDPNISSQFDLRELLINRDGPLPNDRPHNLKLSAAYFIPLGAGEEDGVSIALRFNAVSGTPIEYLGRHPTYGRLETFILPRGSGGRTPAVTTLDVRAGYLAELAPGYKLELTADVFNALNQQQVTQVDQEYTFDPVLPIAGGSPADLRSLKTISGTQPALNPNYGQPTARQPPLSMRLGARLVF